MAKRHFNWAVAIVLVGAVVILAGGVADTHILDASPAFFLAILTGMQSGLPLALSRQRKG